MTQICAVTDDVILAIMQNCPQLVSMNVGLCSHVTDQGIHHIAKYGKNIERLYLVSCKITDEGTYSVCRCHGNQLACMVWPLWLQ